MPGATIAKFGIVPGNDQLVARAHQFRALLHLEVEFYLRANHIDELPDRVDVIATDVVSLAGTAVFGSLPETAHQIAHIG